MPANWAVIEQLDESGCFLAYHVVPMVNLDGEAVISAAHELHDGCQCRPRLEHGDDGWDIWNHNDPDHPGAGSVGVIG